MVPILSLWLPILLSAVLVFIVSSILHMVFTYHNNDFGKIPSEDEVMDALRKFDIPPGDYVIPYAGGMEAMKSEQYKAKMEKGPAAFITVIPSGPPSMGGSLAMWFAFILVVNIIAAYLGGRALGPDAPYLSVFRFVGCSAFIGHSLALLQNSIWYKHNWGATLKSMFDGLIFALLTAGVFGWLWPGA